MQDHKSKIKELLDMTGLKEAAMADAAERELDAALEGADPFDEDANKAARKEERKRDVIEAKPEDYTDESNLQRQTEETEAVPSEDDSDEVANRTVAHTGTSGL